MRLCLCRRSAVRSPACNAAFMRTRRKGFWLEFQSTRYPDSCRADGPGPLLRAPPRGLRPEALMPARQPCRSRAHPQAYASHRSSGFAPTAPQDRSGRHVAARPMSTPAAALACARLLHRASAARRHVPEHLNLLLLACRRERCAKYSRLRYCRQQMSRTPPGLQLLRLRLPRSLSRASSHAYASADSCRMKPALGHAPARALRTSARASPSCRPSSCAPAGAGLGLPAPQRLHEADKS